MAQDAVKDDLTPLLVSEASRVELPLLPANSVNTGLFCCPALGSVLIIFPHLSYSYLTVSTQYQLNEVQAMETRRKRLPLDLDPTFEQR